MGEVEHKDGVPLSPTVSEDLKADMEAGNIAPAKLDRGLQGRHMQMIAIGE